MEIPNIAVGLEIKVKWLRNKTIKKRIAQRMPKQKRNQINRAKINQLKTKALNERQIQSGTTQDVPIYMYHELYGHSLKQVLRKGAVFLLYLETQNYGHWVCLVRHGDLIIYFDPYGEYPDKPLGWSKPDSNKELGQMQPYLLEKMMKTRVQKEYEFRYNTFPFQDIHNPSIATCGDHCVAFLNWVFRSTGTPTIEGYKKYLDQVKSQTGLSTYDQVVTYLFYDH